jgi:hypothetical protein
MGCGFGVEDIWNMEPKRCLLSKDAKWGVNIRYQISAYTHHII